MPQPRLKFEPPVFTFRVRILGGGIPPAPPSDAWREIECPGSLTLGDLAGTILRAFEFDDDHLWSFYLSGKAWDARTEYALIANSGLFGKRPPKLAGKHKLRDIPLPKKEFLFLFDYGDEWHFGVTLTQTSDTLTSGGRYPRVVASQGNPPPQYPDFDDEDWDDEDELAEELDEDQ